jgi:integrase
LRQSEIFGLKWGDIDFERGTMSVIRSIVYGVAGPCKTESSQKPVPMHPTLADALMQWRKRCTYINSKTGFLQVNAIGPKALLGSGDLAQIHTSRSGTSRNPEAIRMAYVPAHLLDSAATCGD